MSSLGTGRLLSPHATTYQPRRGTKGSLLRSESKVRCGGQVVDRDHSLRLRSSLTSCTGQSHRRPHRHRFFPPQGLSQLYPSTPNTQVLNVPAQWLGLNDGTDCSFPPITNTPPNRSQVKHFCQNLQALLQPKKLYCPQVHELTEAKSPSLEDQTLTLGTAAQLREHPAFVSPSLQKRAASTGEIAGCLPTTLFAGLRRNNRDERLKGLKGRVRGK